jgi:hypothetical protein
MGVIARQKSDANLSEKVLMRLASAGLSLAQGACLRRRRKFKNEKNPALGIILGGVLDGRLEARARAVWG